MINEQQILHILSEVGERGISVSMLTKHVYNLNCTLFSQPDVQDVHRQVQQYLLKNSKSSQSLIESAGRRGYYRLNTQNNADARQLMLEFQEEVLQEETESEKPQVDLSLSLFDEF
jgi:hypothetical protein